MHFQQVCLTALAFSSAHGGSLQKLPSIEHFVSIRPPHAPQSEIVIEQDLLDEESWSVRLIRRHNRLLHIPVHFPPVRTQEDLLDTLVKAWRMHSAPPAPFLTRFVEPPLGVQRLTRPPSRTPPRSASPPRRQRGVSPQTPPHPE
jgi:hypothetical protein